MLRKTLHSLLIQILLVFFLPALTSSTITLTQTSSSGSDNLGSCAVSSSKPNCFSSISPQTYEKCSFTSSTAGFLIFQSFDVASPSFIQLGKIEYTSGAPNGHYVNADEPVKWSTSYSVASTTGTFADAEGKLPCQKCQSGKFTAGTGTQYCQSTYVQGDDIMDDGDILTMAEGTFSCTVPNGTPYPCANAYRMLHITDLSGTINCATDAATCVLDGSGGFERRIIDMYNGLSTGKLTFGALKFANGVWKTLAEFLWAVENSTSSCASFKTVRCTAMGKEERYMSMPGQVVAQPWSISTPSRAKPLDIYNPDSNVITSSAMGTCTECAQGKFGVNAAQSSESACFDCGRGKRGLVVGATSDSCVDCEAGTCICSFGKYSTSTSTSCTNCAAGKYIEDDSVTATLHANSDSCVNCPAGKASDESPDNLCDEICLPGTYSVAGSTSCTSCEKGKFNEHPLQPSCVACGAGRYNEDEGSVNEAACRLCSAGKASDEEVKNSPCPECAAGTATAANGMAACSSCPAGSFSNDAGSYQCDPCSPGSFSLNSGSITCTQCNPGTFNTTAGSVTCEMCPAGQKMNVAGDGCDLCPDGKFSNTGSTECAACDATAGFISLAGEAGAAACEYCGPGVKAVIVSLYKMKFSHVFLLAIGSAAVQNKAACIMDALPQPETSPTPD
ncbi:hypothetical protein TrLO_g6338 [Triparma laevis f. longispina]|uniref:Tyrosine-protein kinase ephrin type A/B receptor-like domain-containing protein n=1 Tax=Triparma laevis f. longispina TaxID=1714387 RepID=A0A9W7CC43_9STRA|nr:hypothetical protein TrLO_g6338 [Triparma laevis f. longispina]